MMIKDTRVDKMDEDITLNVDQLIASLQTLGDNTEMFAKISEDQRIALLKAAGVLTRPNREELKKRQKEIKKTAKLQVRINDKSARESTGIRQVRNLKVFTAPEKQLHAAKCSDDGPTLSTPRNCYVCKAEFTRLHHF